MRNFAKSLFAASVLAFSSLSQADPVLTWDVEVVGTWTAWAPDGVEVSDGGTRLSWGVPFGGPDQSSLQITNPGTNSINTYFGGGTPPPGFIANSVELTHNNNPIGAPYLTSAQLTVNVTLTPTDPPAAGFPLPSIAYDIAFLETLNQEPCTVSSPIPCNDIFVLLGGFLNESFVYDSQTYFVNAFPIEGGSLSVLTDAACAAVGQAPNCIGFTTPEFESTNLAFGLTISSDPLQVPEPGSLALIGLALTGLAVARRGRRAA